MSTAPSQRSDPEPLIFNGQAWMLGRRRVRHGDVLLLPAGEVDGLYVVAFYRDYPFDGPPELRVITRALATELVERGPPPLGRRAWHWPIFGDLQFSPELARVMRFHFFGRMPPRRAWRRSTPLHLIHSAPEVTP